jgi:hypothetical protein
MIERIVGAGLLIAVVSFMGMMITGICGFYPSLPYYVFGAAMLSGFGIFFLVLIYALALWVFTGKSVID